MSTGTEHDDDTEDDIARPEGIVGLIGIKARGDQIVDRIAVRARVSGSWFLCQRFDPRSGMTLEHIIMQVSELADFKFFESRAGAAAAGKRQEREVRARQANGAVRPAAPPPAEIEAEKAAEAAAHRDHQLRHAFQLGPN